MSYRMFLLRPQNRGEKLEDGQFISPDKLFSFHLSCFKGFPLSHLILILRSHDLKIMRIKNNNCFPFMILSTGSTTSS